MNHRTLRQLLPDLIPSTDKCDPEDEDNRPHTELSPDRVELPVLERDKSSDSHNRRHQTDEHENDTPGIHTAALSVDIINGSPLPGEKEVRICLT